MRGKRDQPHYQLDNYVNTLFFLQHLLPHLLAHAIFAGLCNHHIGNDLHTWIVPLGIPNLLRIPHRSELNIRKILDDDEINKNEKSMLCCVIRAVYRGKNKTL